MSFPFPETRGRLISIPFLNKIKVGICLLKGEVLILYLEAISGFRERSTFPNFKFSKQKLAEISAKVEANSTQAGFQVAKSSISQTVE